jgi:hypothetical protein
MVLYEEYHFPGFHFPKPDIVHFVSNTGEVVTGRNIYSYPAGIFDNTTVVYRKYIHYPAP